MGIAGRHDSLLNTTTPLCVFLLVIIISASSGKAATNLLLTKEILEKNSELSYPNSKVSLKLEDDCNLVLYNATGDKVWASNTSHPFIPPLEWPKCTVSFTDNGSLVLNGTTPNKEFSWITPNADSKVGKYVAILRPEGKISIHGPSVWTTKDLKESIGSDNNDDEIVSTGDRKESIGSDNDDDEIVSTGDRKESIGSDNNDDEIVSSITNLKKPKTVYNVLFSGQELKNNSKLTDGEYSFILQECDLFLKNSSGKVSWRTRTELKSKCIAKLNNIGELFIKEVIYPGAIVNINKLPPHRRRGEYALVMQKNGEAVIYGPKVWYAPHGKSGIIQMRATYK